MGLLSIGFAVCQYLQHHSYIVPRLFIFTNCPRDKGDTINYIFMSKNLSVLLFVLSSISLSSCTKLVYSTDQYLSDLRSKKDVVDRFGLPAEQREGEGITEWLYDYGTVGVGGAYSLGSVNSSYGSATGSVSTVSVFSNFHRYVKFTFDRHGNMTRYEYRGVDFSERKKAPGKTIALIVIGAVVIVGLIALGASDD